MISKTLFFIFLLLIVGSDQFVQAQEVKLSDILDFEVQAISKNDKLKTGKLSDLIGKQKIVVIDLWATWCGPCRQSMTDLTALQTEYKDKDLQVIGLSVEAPEQIKAVLGVRSNLKINYQLGFATAELFRAMDQRAVLPQTFVFGYDGILIRQIRGWSPTLGPKIMRESIEIALKQKQK